MQCSQAELTVVLVQRSSMQVTKGTWRMREQCVPGSLSSSPSRDPGNDTSYGPACGRVNHPYSATSNNRTLVHGD